MFWRRTEHPRGDEAYLSGEAFSFILLSFGCGFMLAAFLVAQISPFMTAPVTLRQHAALPS